MSLSSILNIATSGLNTAQTQLRVVSDNVSNVNTPGYVRKVAEQQSLNSQGVGAGVEVARIRLATDRFLQAASLSAGAESARHGVRYELYDRIQSLFGDPGGDTGFFAQVDEVFSAFASASEDAASSPRRQEALFRTQALFDEAARISNQIQAVREDADGRLQSAVEKANGLLEQIEGLNKEIASATVTGGDASGAETAQASLLDQLAELMDIRITQRTVGGVTIRTGAGVLLAGEGHATLEYHRAGSINTESAFGEIWVTEPRGQKRALLDSVTSGEIKGLVELRDVEAPQAAERLGELMTRMADELNRAHNANSSLPAPNRLTGRNVGQSLETALTGFDGNAVIAITSPAGALVQKIELDFLTAAEAGGPGVRINGSATVTPMADFVTEMNTTLGGNGAVSFAGGVLSIQASGSNGVAIGEGDPASGKAGRGFSHYFGLNDLIVTDRPALYDQGLNDASLHGFAAGQSLTFRFMDQSGAKARDVAFAIPAGADTMGALVTALNDPSTGLGRYGTFTLDQTSGELTFTPKPGSGQTMSVLEDRTTQNPSGVSLTELFGIGGGVRASRADGFSVRVDVSRQPSLLALGELDVTVTAGQAALKSGDGRGARRLGDAGQNAAPFAASGDSPGGSISVSRYASELSGDIGGKAAASKSRADAAGALYEEAQARQVAQEGVNLNEELVLMTTYQQAFNASARLIQAARDMYDTLLGMV